MKIFQFLLMLSLSFPCFSKEECDLKSIGVEETASNIEKYFFAGTCHYRNKDYHLSVESWEKITVLPASTEYDEGLKISVLNNLGYMMFFGYGTNKNQNKAMQYWKDAILLGHYEAEYHLCHAYADSKQPTYDLSKARTHCKKAQLIYKGMDEADQRILDDIDFYLGEING